MSAKPFNFGSCQPGMLPDGNGGFYCLGGLSIRDWFAGMAIQGAVAYVNEHQDHYDESLANTAIASYKIADAMLAAREGKEEGQ
jgi:hypothetical protein